MAFVPHPIHWLHMAHTWPYSFSYDLTQKGDHFPRKTPEYRYWRFKAVPKLRGENVNTILWNTFKGSRKELNYLAHLFLYWAQNTESKRNSSNIQKEPLTNVWPTGSKLCYTPDTLWGVRRSIRNKNNFSCPQRVHGLKKKKRLMQMLSLREVMPDTEN